MAAAETIVAVSTPAGRGAIAVVRLSGPLAKPVADRCLRWKGKPRPRRMTRVEVLARDGGRLDDGLAAMFPAPGSYTGEDVVEISVHGSPAVASELVLGLLAAGARPARPGEFTQRAFFNGKLDLSQAEAVRDLVESETAFQAKVALEQLHGWLSRELRPVKEGLLRAVAHLETAVEFSEEDVSPAGRRELASELGGLDALLGRLEESFQKGQAVREGVAIAVAGRPNAGKSSLFNALLGRERAIVTELAGTTRDAVQEMFELNGAPARLVDTAGIRETTDLVERLGLEKTKEFLGGSDVVLFVVDGSAEWGPEDDLAWRTVQELRKVVALNKSDLARAVAVPGHVGRQGCEQVEVSARTGSGLDRLREALWRAAVGAGGGERECGVLTNARHKRCLGRGREELRKGTESLREGWSEEFAVHHLKRSLRALGEITGETTDEDVLDRIFAEFCIGK